jgi:hypothetical protein
MRGKASVWIDHKQAVIVFVTKQGEEVEKIISNVEKHVRSLGGSRSSTPYTHQDVAAGNRLERKRMGHLHTYYNDVLACLRDAEAILILGPGKAKTEFQKHVESSRLWDRIVAVEPAEKMTQAQLVARTREHFFPGTSKKRNLGSTGRLTRRRKKEKEKVRASSDDQ